MTCKQSMSCPKSASLLQGQAVPQPANSQQTQPSTAPCATRQTSLGAARGDRDGGWSALVSRGRPQSPLRHPGVAAPSCHQPAAHSTSFDRPARRALDGEQTARGEPQSPRLSVAAHQAAGRCGSPGQSLKRVDPVLRQGQQTAPPSPMRAFASLELPTEELDEALQLQLLSPTLAAGVSTPMLHQVRPTSCTDRHARICRWIPRHSSGMSCAISTAPAPQPLSCLAAAHGTREEHDIQLSDTMGLTCMVPQGLTPHLSAMSPLDAVSLQMAAALASNFASPCPPDVDFLPAPGLPPQRHRHEPPWPAAYGGGNRGLSEHPGLRHGPVGLPPVHHSGPAGAMGTTSSAGVIAAARRAVAAAAVSAHGDFGAVSYAEQQQRQRPRSDSASGYRAEVSK